MYSMAQERRMEQKARYRFLRTAVNSPFAPKNKKQQHFPTESKISTARMLISEFEILMVRLTRLLCPGSNRQTHTAPSVSRSGSSASKS